MSTNAAPGQPEAPKPDAKPKPRPEFSHPALKAIGIPSIRLPSRNWMIFFGVTGTFFGAITYDRKCRVAKRDELKSQVDYLADLPISGLDLPRKVTVYMAPPPSDQIDITMRHWRRNLKPILTAAAVDFDIVDEDKQGHIRTVVAEGIRNQRRAAQGLPTTGYTPDDLDLKINEKTNKHPSGGVICLGRGAYKEYMAGLQEGWMGPLEEPQFVKDDRARAEELKRIEAEEKLTREAEAAAAASATGPIAEGAVAAEKTLEKVDIPEPPKEEKKDAKPEAKKKEVTPTWLTTDMYPEAQVDPLFYQQRLDPILVVRNPHLLGFMRTPQRFGRYLTRRNYFSESATQAKALVLEQTRPFVPEDVDAAIVEENDWPAKWKQKGLDKNSEWMRDLKVDDRIAAHLEVYDVTATPQAAPAPVKQQQDSRN